MKRIICLMIVGCLFSSVIGITADPIDQKKPSKVGSSEIKEALVRIFIFSPFSAFSTAKPIRFSTLEKCFCIIINFFRHFFIYEKKLLF